MEQSKCLIGIEFGSTRIKSIIIDESGNILSKGEYTWENSFVDGIWTYSLEDAKIGLQTCFKNLRSDFESKYSEPLHTCGAIGISGMMHGYLVFDKEDKQLANFKTWRNTDTGNEAEILSKELNFNIPMRWSASHLFKAVINKNSEVNKICFSTTLAGYFHYLLTGEKVLGICDASGMFPIDSKTLDYDSKMVEKFNKLIEGKTTWKILDILPKVKIAGEFAGILTKEGAMLLDPSGEFKPGVPLVPPEGDMGTGMVATNSVRQNTGNSSFGTSSNTTIISNKKIGVHRELDIIASPSGYPAALIHVNNCTTDINHWVSLLKEAITLGNGNISDGELYSKLFAKSLEADNDAGGLMSVNYYSGEGISNIYKGKPLFYRSVDSTLNLANFMKAHILSTLGTMKIGIAILEKEGIKINKIYGHGGFFKTPHVGSKALSSAINAPVAIRESAGEGGPYGMALLASYYLFKEKNETLENYLDDKIFKDVPEITDMASKEEIDGFNNFYKNYLKALDVEKEVINEK